MGKHVCKTALNEYDVYPTENGLDIYQGETYRCTLEGRTLEEFEGDDGEIDDDKLDEAIYEKQEFLEVMEKCKEH